jgi:DNA helicase-2/ATP-dependent DNA helicase PcrA
LVPDVTRVFGKEKHLKTFAADLHLHSRHSRATSRNFDLERMWAWGRKKGLGLLGTGDFTHPGWRAELKEKLVPEGNGLFRLRDHPVLEGEEMVPDSCPAELRFILQVEISSIYKRAGKVRKVHNLVYLPDLEAADRFSALLGAVGNLGSDGRPILGLDSRDLLAMALESSRRAVLIPAHIWTPWFSVLGSRSGFDSIEDCYGELSEEIFALETGLSSDPPMNWRVSALDRYTLVSNSDAHSPSRIGREATLMAVEPGYDQLFDALRSGDPALCRGTVEFFPEEGKYHLDGHRACGKRMTPAQTLAADGLCPGCGKAVTVGVAHRVEALADRDGGSPPAGALPYHRLVSLPQIIGEIEGVGAGSKKVARIYGDLLTRLGPELRILLDVPEEDLSVAGGQLLAEGVKRVRLGTVSLSAGYDGVFGTVRIFEPGELG